ncbi:unconventional myosin-Va-like isoform X4 [Convolutriloba macropyga]|uniref:unconventional myosin-Va-like isoform X4 n=1 Tax=Convolutriloba macropyga TaxID=536237 RepID=UPI003F51CFEB
MSVEELYVKDVQVWVKDPETVWKPAIITKNLAEGKLVVKTLDTGDEINFDVAVKNTELPPLRNPEILIGQNDLTSLSYLHEPAVLHNLKVRFTDNYQIYTYCGIVLVAINPYKSLPLYSNDVVQAYSGQDFFSMDPHVFAVAEEAYKNLAIEEKNQSVIISGESGAGKTVSAKYVMRYLASVTSDWSEADRETHIEQRVLASNPIMEAIGNAKTTRNDNSSRFGKYIEILFSSKHTIAGAHMKTYLLEKSRVTFQVPTRIDEANEERNYHIFYQLCASADSPEFCELHLGPCDQFVFTNQGNCPVINNVNDAEELENTREAFQMLGINSQTQLMMFQIWSAVLHMGNLHFVDDGNEGCKISDANKHLERACDMLGIDLEQTAMWLCYRKIQTMNEIMTKPLNAADGMGSRNALCRHIYANLFNWIVDQINKVLAPNFKAPNFIGVLDIYGFETFQINSFEQFCINYANEKLQQQFTQHVFKLEQEEYVKEEISWSFIEFYDNQPCLELIEGKIGILNLLDEECKMPRGSDLSWCQKLYNNHLKKSSHFDKPRMSQKAFIINHFADKVQYESMGFLIKNKDTVFEEHVNLLKASQFRLVAEIFEERATEAVAQKPRETKVTRVSPMGPRNTKNLRKTVGGQFKDSLKHLMDSLNSTTPHYIRCIKPNDQKEPFAFDPKRAVQQLRACGVLETIRISAAGFPSRWSYNDFFKRYRVLMHSGNIDRDNVAKTCEYVLTKYINDPDKFQFGKTKIFFRAGQVAYLEKIRLDKLKAACILIQKTLRCFTARKLFLLKKKSIVKIQKVARGFMARRRVYHIRRERAAIRIQKTFRCYRQRKSYKQIYGAIVKLQCFARVIAAKREYTSRLRNSKATIIQKYFRRWSAVRNYENWRRAIILAQCCWRRRVARKEFKELKIQARSVDHLKQLNKGMENKIFSLQNKINELNHEKEKMGAQIKMQSLSIDQLNSKLEIFRKSDDSAKELTDRLTALETENFRLNESMNVYSMEKAKLEEILTSKDSKIAELETANKELTSKVEVLEKQVSDVESKINDQSIKEVEYSNKEMEHELASTRGRYQTLLHDYSRLEQRYENLQEELKYSQQRGGAKRPYSNGYDDIANDSGICSDSQNKEILDDDHATGSGSVKSGLDGIREEAGDTDDSSTMRSPHHLGSGTLAANQQQLSSTATVDFTNTQEAKNLREKVKAVEMEKAQLEEEMHSYMKESTEHAESAKAKINHLQKENERLQEEVVNFGKLLAAQSEGGDLKEEVERLMNAVNEQLRQKSEENLVLEQKVAELQTEKEMAEKEQEKAAASQAVEQSMKGTMTEDWVNEEGEMMMAYQSAKDTNRLLEAQLQAMTKNFKLQEKELREEITKHKHEIEKQQRIISEIAAKYNIDPKNKALVQALSSQADLRAVIDSQDKIIKKLRRQSKAGSTGKSSDDESGSRKSDTPSGSPLAGRGSMAGTNSIVAANGTHLNRKGSMHQQTFHGMLSYTKSDEQSLVRNLIIDLKPVVAATMMPNLPSYVILMCIRHCDHLNDDFRVRSLLHEAIVGVKKAIKKRFDDAENVTLWLSNCVMLLQLLKQYSGEEIYMSKNSDAQNQQCLRNFDLTEYRNIIHDLAIQIYQNLVRIVDSKLQPMIVKCMLEHESVSPATFSTTGSSGAAAVKLKTDSLVVTYSASNQQRPNQPLPLHAQGGGGGRFAGANIPKSVSGMLENEGLNKIMASGKNMGAGGKRGGQDTGKKSQFTLDTILKQLSIFLNVFSRHSLDFEVVKQLFKQIIYIVVSSTVNNLLLRREMCHWFKGMQIRYNLSELEEWLRNHRLADPQPSASSGVAGSGGGGGTLDQLTVLVEFAQLLQVGKKTDADVDNIVTMCKTLSSQQIIKVLSLYTPINDYEDKVSVDFIRKTEEKLKTRPKPSHPTATISSSLLMDSKHLFPITFPYHPSQVNLNSVTIPETLSLDFLKRV